MLLSFRLVAGEGRSFWISEKKVRFGRSLIVSAVAVVLLTTTWRSSGPHSRVGEVASSGAFLPSRRIHEVSSP